MAAQLVSARRRGRQGYQKMSDINVTPFIDVMLVLLIVFMVTAPLIIAGAAIELPADSAAIAAAPDDRTIVLKVGANGDITLKDKKVEPAVLVPEIQRLAAGDLAKPIVVVGDRQATYGQVASVLGPLSAAGFTGLALGKIETGGTPAGAPKPAAAPPARKRS
ncbi:MAG: biopolymer transporter ExbD [Alphaproteobacteria bacterium]|nr:biopolymer transporter ExbD [Alphaproteobacteria bacterium]